jgi:predicted cupin superfamily sugar epimerase
VHPRAAQLIDTLALQPHPEGGWFRQLFKSDSRVERLEDRAERAALTTIYFLLIAGAHSRWHRVLSDEVWHWYEGDPLELLVLSDGADAVTPLRLGPLTPDTAPVHVVPAHAWQAARPLGAYTLVGCTVGPGFEFDDFELEGDSTDPEIRRRLTSQ